MRKVKIILSLLIVFVFFSCKNKNEISLENSFEGQPVYEIEPPNQIEQPVEEKWRAVHFVSELEGTWTSLEGNVYQYPFNLDGENYLRWSAAAVDDTERWQNYADGNSISLQQLWNKRFACVNKIYDRAFPFVDENGYQEGLKFFLSGDKIMSRFERFIPVSLLEWNLDFFQISDKGNLRENGEFYLHPADEDWSEKESFLSSGLVYCGAEK